jgi:cyclase
MGVVTGYLPFLGAATTYQHPPPAKTEVAPGVFLFRTQPYGDVGLDGNSIAITSPDGVLVFDPNGTPAAAEQVLGEIRKVSTAPVRYLVFSHWHWDHCYGAEVYKREYPAVSIIAHEKTREIMRGPALEFNRPGIETQLPQFVESLRKKVAALEGATPPAPELERVRQSHAVAEFFLNQKKNVSHTSPDVTLAKRMDIRLGSRDIQVLHHDRAVTPGDVFLYLPKEKLLVTGDLLVNPIPFALSVYPTGWLRTLEFMDTLDASVILPGHGPELRSEDLLHTTMDVFRELLRQGQRARQKGLAVDDAKKEILPALEPLMIRMTNNDPRLNDLFRVYVVDWYLHRVYDELDGPLGDAIAPIPKS